MREKIIKAYRAVGLPRLVIVIMLISLYIAADYLGLGIGRLFEDNLVRTGMNGILVLAMAPAIICGVGMNFGLPVGIVCGIIGGLISIEMDLRGFPALLVAIAISIPLATVAGTLYGKLLNKVKGSEMTVSTYVGFSITSLMCIGWLILPFNSGEIRWPIGKGVRVTISLSGRYDKLLNELGSFKVAIPNLVTGGVSYAEVPTGLLIFFLIFCLFMWLFFRSKTGVAMKAAGDNPKFATSSGINVDRQRLIGTTLSTVLGAIGIVVYAQSYGFYQLYTAPMMMAFPAIAAILIGGASSSKAKISHVIIGTFLFQGLLVVALPVANKILPEGNLSEVMRVIIQYGIILYALTKASGGE